MAKLILAVIFSAEAVEPLAQALLAQKYSVTRISSTGGFLRRSNTTFLIGVEEPRLQGALTIIREICYPYSREEGHAVTLFVVDAVEMSYV